MVLLTATGWADDEPSPEGKKPPVEKEKQKSEGTLRLPEIVVTPTRREADPFQVPYSVQSLGAGRLEETAPSHLTEALSEVPGVMAQDSAYAQAAPSIRGFAGSRVLMLIDGIRYNNSVFRRGPNEPWATVDALSISRLELVKGPSSALYGSDAVGGTVNAIPSTRDPRDGGGWDRRVHFRAASAEHSTVERVELSGLPSKRLGLLLGYSRKDFGDQDAGQPTGRQEATAYHERDWDGALVWRPGPDTFLTLVHQQVRQKDTPRAFSTVFSQSFHDTLVGTDLLRVVDQSRDLTYLKLRTENADSFFDKGGFTLSHQVQGEQQDRIQTNALDVQGFQVETLGASLQFESPAGRHALTYGGEFYHDRVSSFRGNFNAAGGLQQWRPRGTVADDASYDLYGAYLQDEIAVSERWDLTLGARYTHAEATAFQVADPFDTLAAVRDAPSVRRAWDNLSGNARLLWKATEAVHPFAGIAQGFRAPNLSDLTQFDSARSGEVTVPATDLEPEETLTKELGIKCRDAQLSWQAAYYHTEIDGMIERSLTGETSGANKVVRKMNVGDGYVQGVELQGSLRLDESWGIFGTADWQEGQLDTFVTSRVEDKDKRPMSRIPPKSLLLGVRWDAPTARKAFVEGSGKFVDGQSRLSPDDIRDSQRIPPGGTLNYKVFTLRGGFEVRPGVSMTLAVENVLDEDYRILGAGSNSPGRNLVLAMDARF